MVVGRSLRPLLAILSSPNLAVNYEVAVEQKHVSESPPGFEPETSDLKGRCSTRLSYEPKKKKPQYTKEEAGLHPTYEPRSVRMDRADYDFRELGESRTLDLRSKNPPLYHLSYQPKAPVPTHAHAHAGYTLCLVPRDGVEPPTRRSSIFRSTT